MDRRQVLGMAAGLAVTGLTPSAAWAAPTPNTVIRPEVGALSDQQRERFFGAVTQLHADGRDTNFTRIHNENVSAAHGVPAFLPWNRHFLRLYELELQRYDPSVVLPHWDFSRDSQDVARSKVLGYFGGLGVVSTGPFKDWQFSYPNKHALRRTTDTRITLYSPPQIDTILQRATSYDQLRRSIEGSPFANVMVGIGGTDGDLSFMYAPNDPLFWMIACFVDRLWWEWQQRDPNLARTYNGGSAQSTDKMRPFDVTVATVLDTLDTDYDYTYERWSGATS